MKSYSKVLAVLFVAATIFSSQIVKAQVVLKLNNEKSSMTIDGTSTLHDWSSKVNHLTGEITMSAETADNPTEGAKLEGVVFNADVKSIESGRGNTMDNRSHKALKADQHPQIIFQLSEGTINKVQGNEFALDARGSLSIAGVTKPIDLIVTGEKSGDNNFSFTGSKAIDMTEFDIEPPTAMFGQIETGKDVDIKFNLVFLR